MKKWFKSQSKLIRFILLLIPITGYICEILLRWEKFLNSKNVIDLILAIVVTIPSGIALGIIDAIWTLLFDKIILE